MANCYFQPLGGRSGEKHHPGGWAGTSSNGQLRVVHPSRLFGGPLRELGPRFQTSQGTLNVSAGIARGLIDGTLSSAGVKYDRLRPLVRRWKCWKVSKMRSRTIPICLTVQVRLTTKAGMMTKDARTLIKPPSLLLNSPRPCLLLRLKRSQPRLQIHSPLREPKRRLLLHLLLRYLLPLQSSLSHHHP